MDVAPSSAMVSKENLGMLLADLDKI